MGHQPLRVAGFLLACLFVSSAAGSAGPAVVIVVRHAEKAAAPAADPPLTTAGEQRAGALAEALADTRIDAIISTQYVRTRTTAGAIAAERGIKPVIVPAGGDVDADVRAVADAVRARGDGEAVLVVGHSNTVPAIIAALGGPKMPALCDSEYANLFILIMSPGAPRLIRSHFGVPDPPSAADCNRVMKQEKKK